MSLDYIKQLEDPYYLPLREEILQKYKEELCSIFMNNYDRSKIEHEFVTQELVQGLTNHLANYLDKERVSLLEVCAGNGRLAYHMQKSLQEKYGDKFDYHAVDNGDQNRENKLPIVENIDNFQGLEKYNPDIILCSRLPFHPYNILPKGFQDRFNYLSKKKKDLTESKDYAEMCKVFISARDGNDITHYRRQKSNVKEYILIGNTSSTGDIRKTFGYKEGYVSNNCYIDFSKEELEKMRMEENPLFKQDGFTKKELDIPTLNRTNVMFGFKDKRDNSQIFSFKKSL